MSAGFFVWSQTGVATRAFHSNRGARKRRLQGHPNPCRRIITNTGAVAPRIRREDNPCGERDPLTLSTDSESAEEAMRCRATYEGGSLDRRAGDHVHVVHCMYAKAKNLREPSVASRALKNRLATEWWAAKGSAITSGTQVLRDAGITWATNPNRNFWAKNPRRSAGLRCGDVISSSKEVAPLR